MLTRMIEDERIGDDIADLAALVLALAERLEELAPEEDSTMADLRARVRQLTSPARGPIRLSSVSANSVVVTEPGGLARLVITGRGTFPTQIQIAGQVIEHRREVAGMLFFSDEGDECGGLTYGGEDGHQGGILAFDQYHGDQVVQIWHEDSPSGRTAGLVVSDQPNKPATEIIERFEAARALPEAERSEAFRRLRDEGFRMTERVIVGKSRDGSSEVTLADANGVVRIAMRVRADGTPSIEVLDSDNNPIWHAP